SAPFLTPTLVRVFKFKYLLIWLCSIVNQLYNARAKSVDRNQFKTDSILKILKQWFPCAEYCRVNGDSVLINEVMINKSFDKTGAAIEPDIFPGLVADLVYLL